MPWLPRDVVTADAARGGVRMKPQRLGGPARGLVRLATALSVLSRLDPHWQPCGERADGRPQLHPSGAPNLPSSRARSSLQHGLSGSAANVARPVPGSPDPGSAGHLAGPSAFGSVALSGAREGSRSWEFSMAGSR